MDRPTLGVLALMSLATLVASSLPAQEPLATKRADATLRRGLPGNLIGHGGPVKAVRMAPDGRNALTGSFDYAMTVWDLSATEPKAKFRLDGHGGAVNATALTPDGGRALAAGDDGTVSLYDLATGALVHRFAGHDGRVLGLAVALDGRTAATAGWDRTARLWDLVTLTPGPVLAGHKGPVNAVQFAADGRRVFTASADATIGGWSRADGAFDRPLYTHGWGINVLEQAPGAADRLVFGALDGTAGIVDADSGVLVRELPAHARPVLALAVLDQPGLIATGGGDGIIRVVRASDGATVEEYRNPAGPVWALAFKPDGSGLYWGGLDDFVSLWKIAPREPFEPALGPFPRRFQVRGPADSQLARGELQFARKCSVCHTLDPDGGNRAGPSLHRVFGRRIATLPGYPFSEPLRHLDIVWDADTIARLFELGPDVFTPGSKMPLQKMTDPAERAALIEYLKVASK